MISPPASPRVLKVATMSTTPQRTAMQTKTQISKTAPPLGNAPSSPSSHPPNNANSNTTKPSSPPHTPFTNPTKRPPTTPSRSACSSQPSVSSTHTHACKSCSAPSLGAGPTTPALAGSQPSSSRCPSLSTSPPASSSASATA